jgi:excisionase family DNA binding protein
LNTGIDKRLCLEVKEAAEMPGTSRNYCYELVKRGLIPSIRLGNRIVIPRAALEEMLENVTTECKG